MSSGRLSERANASAPMSSNGTSAFDKQEEHRAIGNVLNGTNDVDG